MTDEELMAAAKDRRASEAFDELYRRYAPQLRRFLYRLTSDFPSADDLVQETFLRVLQSRTQWDGATGQFRPWLFTIARNVAIGWMRRRAGDANLGRALEKELRCIVRRASQFLEARLAACASLIVDRLRGDCPGSGYRSVHRDWLSLHLDHPPKDLFQAAFWSVQVSGRCVPGQA